MITTSSIWIHPLILQDVNLSAKNSLSDHLNIVFVEVGETHLTARMPIHPIHLQPLGIMHGGATAVLAETVANTAANHCVDYATKTCVGVELNINHLRAVQEGFVDAIASPLHIGKTTQVWEIKIYKSDGILVSAARLTVAVLDKRIPKLAQELAFWRD